MQLEVDGKPVFAATGGPPFDPALPAVVFVHGAGMDHTVWQLQTRYFAHRGKAVLAVDLPGHGRSEGPPLGSVEALGAWIERLLDAAGVERAALVGHSMGALAALAAAAHVPERVRALALLGVTARIVVNPELQAAADRGDHLAYELVTSWAFAPRSHRGGHKAPGLWMMGSGMRLLERARNGVLANDLAAAGAYEGALAAAAKLECPALLLLGEGDLMTPPKGAKALAAGIAGSRTITLPCCGHMMMIEQPDRTLDALRQIL